MDPKSKRYIIIILVLLSAWSLVVLLAVSTLPSDMPISFRFDAVPFHGENSLSYPFPEPDCYCKSWNNSREKTF